MEGGGPTRNNHKKQKIHLSCAVDPASNSLSLLTGMIGQLSINFHFQENSKLTQFLMQAKSTQY